MTNKRTNIVLKLHEKISKSKKIACFILIHQQRKFYQALFQREQLGPQAHNVSTLESTGNEAKLGILSAL